MKDKKNKQKGLKKSSKTDKHHRRARRYGGTDIWPLRNVVAVCIKQHVAFHVLFENPTPTEIAEELNKTWLDPDWIMIPIQKESFAAVARAIGHMIPEGIRASQRRK